MVIHDQNDWRDLDDSLALDVTLVESVFYRLFKRERDQRLELASTNNHEIPRFDTQMFAKANVLSALEKTDGYLEKRPWLRVLHTRLACVSIASEGATVQDFVCSRQRDRTVCLSDIKHQLEAIYADAKRSKEIEDKHLTLVKCARATSPWCVYNLKWLHSSPARQLYHVHALPQAEMHQQEKCDWVATQARAVVNAAVGLVLDKMAALYIVQPLTNEIRTDRRLTRDTLNARRSRQPDKLNHERESKVRALRLELLAPTANFMLNFVRMKGQDSVAQVMMQLATVEAQGDLRVARLLLNHSIVQSGLRRAAEQAQRLGTIGQPWAVVKLWRDLYRTSTLQAIEAALYK